MSQELYLDCELYIKYLESQIVTTLIMKKVSNDRVKYKVSLLNSPNEVGFSSIQIHPYIDNKEVKNEKD